MRKLRVNIFDDDVNILKVLGILMSGRDYEVQAFEKALTCPIHHGQASDCRDLNPCADIIITDYQMPEMTGIEMLLHQSEKKCPIDKRNKALITGDIYRVDQTIIRELECAFFAKPLRIHELFTWLDACEKRIDLSRPLWSIQRENRYYGTIDMVYACDPPDKIFNGTVINYSNHGLCFITPALLQAEQSIAIRTELPNGLKHASVRWVKPAESGFYRAGVTAQ